MTPHKCPVCDGSGTVSRPPWIAGDQQSWASASVDLYVCPACNGSCVVWEGVATLEIRSPTQDERTPIKTDKTWAGDPIEPNSWITCNSVNSLDSLD